MRQIVTTVPVGVLAMQAQLASPALVQSAQEHATRLGRPLIESLVGGGRVSESDLSRVLSEHLDLPRVNLESCQPDPGAVARLSAEYCRKHLVFPVELANSDGFTFLVLAMVDPLDTQAIRSVYQVTGLRVRPLVAQASDVCEAIARVYKCAFEPLMGVTVVRSATENSVADEVTHGSIDSDTPLVTDLFFDSIENILGPYFRGEDESLETVEDACRALELCMSSTRSARDTLTLRIVFQLVKSGQLNPLVLLSPSSSASNKR